MRTNDYIDHVLRRAKAMATAGLWDRPPKVHPEAWLNNFNEADRFGAAIILDHVVYLREDAISMMMESVLRRLLTSLRVPGEPIANLEQRASKFIPRALWTYVEGEQPNPSDSGHLFCRYARRWIDEGFMYSPADAARIAGQKGYPVVLLDDFIGSGDQAMATWYKHFRTAYSQNPFEIYYVCSVATSYGIRALAVNNIPIKVLAHNTLTENDSITHRQFSPFVSAQGARAEVMRVITSYTPRLHKSPPPLGYSDLGLTIAFNHKVPDATLPLIYMPGAPNWTPLVETT